MIFRRFRFQLIAVVLSGTMALLCVGYHVHSQEAASTPVSKVERRVARQLAQAAGNQTRKWPHRTHRRRSSFPDRNGSAPDQWRWCAI